MGCRGISSMSCRGELLLVEKGSFNSSAGVPGFDGPGLGTKYEREIRFRAASSRSSGTAGVTGREGFLRAERNALFSFRACSFSDIPVPKM